MKSRRRYRDTLNFNTVSVADSFSLPTQTTTSPLPVNLIAVLSRLSRKTACVVQGERADMLGAGFDAYLPTLFAPDKLAGAILTVLND